MFYIGIDIAKHNHEASIIDSDGSLLCESISFSNSQKGCEKLIALLERFSVDPGQLYRRYGSYRPLLAFDIFLSF